MKKLLFFLLIILVVAGFKKAGATHLMGGDLTYRNIGNNKVEVSFAIYRDCKNSNNAALDAYIDYRVYDASAVAKKDYSKYTTNRVYYISKKSVKPDIPNCKVPSTICVEYGAYIDTFTLGNDTVGYHVVWMRNERNNSAITNLDYGTCAWWGTKQPYGSVWYTFIPPKTTVNSSPKFLTQPIPYLCAGRTNVFNSLVSDADNDSLVFSLETPYSPPGDCNNSIPTPVPPGHSNFQKVVYKSGYSLTNPFGGTSSISIDPLTGEITAKPVSTGNYVIAMQVKEYRVDPVTKRSVLVGEIRRDIQFVVDACPANDPPKGSEDTASVDSTQVDPSKKQTFYVDPGDTIKFTVVGKDTSDTLYVTAKGGIFKETPTIVPPYATFTNDTGLKEVKGDFFWVPTCNHITYTSPHVVTVNISDNGCNTTVRTYSIYVKSPVIQKPPKLHCLQQVDGNTIKIVTSDSATKKDFLQYNIYRRKGLTGAFSLIDTFATVPIKEYTDSKAFGADTVVYSYFIKAKNKCGLEGLASDTLSTIIISTQKITHKKVKFSWNKLAGSKAVTYKVYAKNASGYSLHSSISATEITFYECDRIVDIKVEAGDATCTFMSMPSKTVILKDDKAPKAAVLQNVTVENHGIIKFSFTKSDSADARYYIIHRSENGGAFAVHDTLLNTEVSAQNTYIDNSVNASSKTYCYKIVTLDSCLNSAESTTHCAVNMQGVSGNYKNILSWTKYVGYTADNVEIQRLNSGIWKKIGSVGADSTNFTDTTAICGTTYFYRILYKDKNSSFSTKSDTLSLKTTDTVSPAKVDFISASVFTQTSNVSILIFFKAVADKDVKKYELYYSTNGGSFSLLSSFATPTLATDSTATYSLTSLNPDKNTYCFKLFAVDSCGGNKSPVSETHCLMQLTGKAQNNAVVLNWTKYKGFDYTKYVVLQLTKSPSIIDTTTDTFVMVEKLPCNKLQTFSIIIYQGDSQFSNWSRSDTITLKPFDTIRPTQPIIHTVSVKKGDKKVDLSWTKTPDADVKEYIIKRTNYFSNKVYIDTVAADTFYTDVNINADDSIYNYTVTAFDSCALNLSTSSVKFSTIKLTHKIVGCEQKITLKWKFDKLFLAGIKEFKIYKTTDGGTEQVIKTALASDTVFEDLAVLPEHKYTYRLEAFSTGGTYVASSNTTDTLETFIPEPPFIYSASKTVTSQTNGSIEVSWRSQKNSRYMSHHKLYARQRGGTNFILLDGNIPVSKNTFTHNGINTQNADYEYLILTVDSCGTVADSVITHTTSELSMTVGQLIHDLKWTPYKGFNNDTIPAKYIIQHLQGNVWADVDSVTNGDTAWVLFPAPCNYNIFYRVKAVSSEGYFAYTDTAGGQAIDTIPANAPIFNNLSVINGSETKIDFTGADSADIFGYAILRKNNSGDFEAVGFVPFTMAAALHEHNDITNTLDDAQFYTIATLDSCLNATYSDTFATIQLKGEALNQAVQLNWHKFKGYGIDNYEVQVWKSNIWQTEKMLSGADTALHIDTLACGIPQSYRIIGYGQNYTTYSDSITLIPFDTISPPAPKLHFVSSDLNGFNLSWSWDVKSDVKYFEVWRRNNSGTDTKITTVTYDSVYYDQSISELNDIWNYYVIAIDSCDMSHRSAPSNTHTTMLLKAETWACQPEARLSWTPYKELAKNTSNYAVYRSSGSGFTQIATIPSTKSTYTDTAVKEGINYCYKIEALSSTSSYTAFSDTICITPIVYPVAAQIQIKGITVTKTGTTNGEVYIEWNKLPVGDPYARGYRLYASPNEGAPYALVYEIEDLDITSFTHKDLDTRESNYLYYVVAYNLCGKNASLSPMHKTVNLHIINQNLKATLLWNTYKGFKVKHYEIEKGAEESLMATSYIVPPTDSIFNDTNIYCGRKYIYRIKAVEENGNNLISHSDTVTITAFDKVAPQPNKILLANVLTTDTANGKIQLTFTSVDDKNRSGFVVYRAMGNGSFVAVDTLYTTAKGILQYTDSTLGTKLSSYGYYLRAIDSCGNIAFASDIHHVMWLKATAKNAYNEVKWTPYKGFVNNTYILERREINGSWAAIASMPSSQILYRDSAVKCNVLYEYRVLAVNLDDNSYISYSNTDSARAFEVILPENPDMLFASVNTTSNGAGTVNLSWNLSLSPDAKRLILYRNDGSGWQAIADLPSISNNYTDINLNTYRNSYEYKFRVVDSCGNTSTDNSEIHKTINLVATAGNENIALNWNAYKGFEVLKYDLYKNGVFFRSFNPFTYNFTDTMVLCDREYLYHIIATDKNTGNTASSNIESTRPYDTRAPKSTYLISASVTNPNNEITVKWAASQNYDAKGYNLYRRNFSKGKIELVYTSASKTDTSFVDTVEIGNDRICYYVEVFDHCNNISKASNNGCIINLAGRAESFEHTLNWNPYVAWPRGVEYYNIYRKKDDGAQEWIRTVNADPQTFTDKDIEIFVADFCYQVEAVEALGGYEAKSLSTEFCLHQEPVIYLPNVFTPGVSPNVNDVFEPVGTYISKYEMVIYNRWGQKVFNSNESKGWNGRTGNDEMLPEGVYMYTIKYYNYLGMPKEIKGTVHLLW